MEIRGDHRNPNEVDAQDILDLDVDNLDLSEEKKKELKQIQ